MGIWRSFHALATGKKHNRALAKRPAADPRRSCRKALALEPLEKRELLALTLSEIVADNGAPIVPGQVRDVAPRELVFRFDVGQQVDPNSLLGIQITRSGDGIFGNARSEERRVGKECRSRWSADH